MGRMTIRVKGISGLIGGLFLEPTSLKTGHYRANSVMARMVPQNMRAGCSMYQASRSIRTVSS